MSSNSSNVNCHSWPLDATIREVDMPLHLPIWALTVEMWNCHSWPLDATIRGVDLPPNLPKLSVSASVKWQIFYHLVLTVERWNCHSDALANIQGGVDLPLALPIWPLTIEIWNWHSLPLDASTWGGRSATWSANMSFNNRNLKLLW